MTDELDWEAVLAWRVARQGLAERAAAADWMDVVRRICGLHAQVQASAELTLWARVEGLSAGVVPDALWTHRTLVRTWAMRGTLHLLPADELAMWVGAQGVIRPRYELASWRKAFGMTSAEAVAVLDAIRDALDGEPLTRDELADAVAERLGSERLGEAVRGSFGTMPKLAAFRGDVVFAKPAGQKVRFTRPDRRLDPGWQPAPPREAMTAVIRRHLAAYGPASRETFARWFGMASAAQAGKLIAGLGDDVAAVSVEGWRAGCCAGTWRRRPPRARAGSSRCCPRSTSTSSRRRARRPRCWPPSTRTACTAGRAGCRRSCSSTGGSPASGGTSASAASSGSRSSRSARSRTSCARAPRARRGGWRSTSATSSSSLWQ